MRAKVKTRQPQPDPRVIEEISLGAGVERMLSSDVLSAQGGYLNGSMSGESWKTFLQTVRDEAVAKLSAYRSDMDNARNFRASSLEPYCEQRMKIEREYLGALVDLYSNAERAYKTLSG